MPGLPLGYTYPILDIFWSMLVFFLFVVWIWIFIMVVVDLFRSHDLSGWAKALWVIFFIVLPFLGVLVYLIARGSKMHEHAVRHAEAQDQAMRQYVQSVSPAPSTADQLAKLADLRDKGVISQTEFDSQKAKLLA